MENKELIDAICKERASLRHELVFMEQTQAKAFFVLVTAFGSMFAVMSTGVLQKNPLALTIFYIMITQLQFVLVILVLAIMDWIMTHWAYARALEEKINDLAGETISFWASRMVVKFVNTPKSTFYLGYALLMIFVSVIFIIAFVLMICELQDSKLWILAALEFCIVFALLGLHAVRFKTAKQFALDQLELKHSNKKSEGNEELKKQMRCKGQTIAFDP